MKTRSVPIERLLCAALLIFVTGSIPATARNGMWIPSLLKQLNESDLKKMGLEIPVEELFDREKGGLNEAIVQFGNGCTGEIVSDQGLLLTNHHCGFGQIQALSTLEHNYLEKGYWSMSQEQELPCPGLTVTFIRAIDEVTDVVMAGIPAGASEEKRNIALKSAADSLEKSHSTDGRKAIVRPFFGGNRYFLFTTETYRDVRLAGTPSMAIGNFGGETDNWVWPRHTGDFSVFRIYANKDNRPADYSKENIPYRPGRHLAINTAGLKEGDFTMVYGFPGRTQQYLTSASIRLIEEQTNPNRIALRDIRMGIYKEAMQSNDTIRLQYASKFKSLANSYKRWKGELIGLRQSSVYERKKELESSATGEAVNTLAALNSAVAASAPYSFSMDYYAEGYGGIELLSLAAKLKPLIDMSDSKVDDPKKFRDTADKLYAELVSVYKNYDVRVDRKIAGALLEACGKNLPDSAQPEALRAYRRNAAGYVDALFSRSLLAHPEKALEFIKELRPQQLKKLSADPAWKLQQSVADARSSKLEQPLSPINEKITRYQRAWIAYLLSASSPENPLAPDANSTLRVSYGKVQGVDPQDGIHYSWQTTSTGILQKAVSGNEDYAADDNLVAVLKSGSTGRFGKDGIVPVAFIASNHTTGGNSGSPVLDAKGRLVGINFDRIWEGVMSDLYYEPALSRNVAVDIRYVLFVIEKVGKCDRLISEMGFGK